jgi:hypothetical protein
LPKVFLHIVQNFIGTITPMVRVRVLQANIEVVVQGGATRVSFVIVWLAVSAALAKRPRGQCANSEDGGDKNDLKSLVHA